MTAATMPRPGRVRFRAIGIAVALVLGSCVPQRGPVAPAASGPPLISKACEYGRDLSNCTVHDRLMLEVLRNYLTPHPMIVGPVQ